MYEFKPTLPNQLEMKKDSIIVILDSKQQQGWSKALINDKEGFVPSNYLTDYVPTKKDLEKSRFRNRRDSELKKIEERVSTPEFHLKTLELENNKIVEKPKRRFRDSVGKLISGPGGTSVNNLKDPNNK